MNVRQIIEQKLNSKIVTMQPLSGGMIGNVYRIELADGQKVVAKTSDDLQANLDKEGQMLTYLTEYSQLPIPSVIDSASDLLLMTYIENQGSITKSVEEDAAHHLARLHNITNDQYGLSFDTLIGGLHQPNSLTTSWIDFFREHRLIYMAQVAYDAGQLPPSMFQRVNALSENLENFLFEPEQPALIHGDMWGGNVLSLNNKIAGFVDPAIYYAHAEIELAFSSLFNTFGQYFFDAYQTLRPIEPDFFTVRRDIYNLYPLLVHVHLFGSGYLTQVESILSRFGY